MEFGARISAGARGMGPPARAEWESIQRETDRELYYEAVAAFAARQEATGSLEPALELYSQLLREADLPAAVANRARERMDAIVGRGALGPRAEFLLRRFTQEASEPSALFAMGVAGAAFRVARLATLSRLTAAPTANILTRGFGARLFSGVVGFGVEAPTFTLAGRVAGEVLGREQDWGLRALGHDIASSFLVLGSLKLAGWGAGSLHRGLTGAVGAVRACPPLRGERPLRILLQQGGMLTGILLGHRMEEWAGLRRPVDGATTLVDSLALLLQFNIAGRLTRHAFGPRFAAWEQGLDLRGEFISRHFGRPPIFPNFQGMQAATAGFGGSFRPPLERRLNMGPGIFAMSSQEGEWGRGSSALSEPTPRERQLEYPSEIDALLREVESTMRRTDYYDGDRSELLAKRPSMETLDRLWFHQGLDLMGRIDYVRTRMADHRLLLEPLPDRSRAPDAELLQRAVDSLGETSPEARRVALQVLEIRFQRAKLNERLFAENGVLEDSLAGVANLIDIQNRLGDRLHLIEDKGDEIIARIPSVSLWEKLLQAAFGTENIQIHPVEGTALRDRVMGLRARRVIPMGFSRHQLILGDLQRWVFPFSFGIHDGYFHGAMDSSARPGFLEFSGRAYEFIQRHLSHHELAESWLDRLSDGELGFSSDVLTGTLPADLRNILRQADANLRANPGAEDSESKRREVLELAESLSRLMREGEVGTRLGEGESNILREWDGFLDEIRGTGDRVASGTQGTSLVSSLSSEPSVDVPSFEYPPDIERLLARMESKFYDPAYFRGDRVQLLARRPEWDDVDGLWHFQGEDYAKRIPGVSSELVDAEALRKIPPMSQSEADPSLLSAALRLMGERGEMGHPARRVLRVFFPVSFLSSSIYSQENGPMRYLGVIPPLLELERYLNNRMGLMTQGESGIYFHFPSLSLLQSLYQAVHGPGSVEFFPVPGNITRSQAALLRSLRLPPIGFSRGLTYFGDMGYEVHPFSFAGHDAVFHAGRDAALPDPLPEISGRFYSELATFLPSHPVSERILNRLSDLEFETGNDPLHKQFHGLFIEPFRTEVIHSQRLPTPEEREAVRRGLVPVAEALRHFVVREYRRHPGIQGREKYLLASLRPFERIP